MPYTNYVERDEKWLHNIRDIVGHIIERTTVLHIDMPETTRKFLKENKSVIYTPLHKSLWETFGILYVCDSEGFPVPYAVMGNNLVKGEFFIRPLTNKLGVIISQRENKSKEKAANGLIETVEEILMDGNSVMSFQEGSRSKDGLTKDFKTTIFQAAINLNAALMTVNVDYSRYVEEREYIRSSGIKKPYTMKIYDVPKWIFKHIGHVYITFGNPIIPSEVSLDRRVLAEYTREQCMNLIKIQPENVVAYAMVQGGDLEDQVKRLLARLEPHSNKFVNMVIDDEPKEIIYKAGISHKKLPMINLYSNEIRHYFEGNYSYQKIHKLILQQKTI